ncbi:EAL domain-containing protein [Terribacillus saccharophilus]|uniref:EAL domain-containing protein n=1 Tax=Terribacillus saccharophilus TaxID=361277 RepID=UPI002989C8F6|nr:EAL domain-containing protein [Terribacillus saccharophilus]MCM3227135.1 EAL domain-containing protein [Terribacillus saccharophilus]
MEQLSVCAMCGTVLDIPEKGELLMRSPESFRNLSLGNPLKQEDTYTIYQYFSLQQLEQMLLSIRSQSISGVRCTVAKKVTNSYPMVSVEELLQRVQFPQFTEIVQKGAFQSFLQPIISMEDEKIFGFEHLLRADKREVSPAALFNFAAEAGLTSMLDQRARKTAVRKRAQEEISDGVKSFINFMPSTIYNPDFCLRQTFHTVEEYGVDPKDLVFEVVETEKLDDVSRLKRIFKRYKEEGMMVALDDVGAGYSTLELLKELEPDFVKIDRAYISYCDTSAQKQEFLYKVMDVARVLGTKVLAEGIERQEELSFCKQIGVDLAQGYFIGKPSSEAVSGNSLFPSR